MLTEIGMVILVYKTGGLPTNMSVAGAFHSNYASDIFSITVAAPAGAFWHGYNRVCLLGFTVL
jgi:hypothetical protein